MTSEGFGARKPEYVTPKGPFEAYQVEETINCGVAHVDSSELKIEKVTKRPDVFSYSIFSLICY